MARRIIRHPSGQEGAAEGPEGACEGRGGAWRVMCHLPRCPRPAHRDRDGVLQEFIREGCLHKLTRKGPQQRMFFLVGAMGAVQAGGLIVRSQERVAETLPGLPPSLFWILGTCLQDEQKPAGRKIHTPAAAGPLCWCQRQFAGPYSRAQRSSQRVPAASRSPFVSSLPRAQLVDSNPSLPGWG